MSSQLFDFLANLAKNPTALSNFKANPESAISAASLDSAHKAALKTAIGGKTKALEQAMVGEFKRIHSAVLQTPGVTQMLAPTETASLAPTTTEMEAPTITEMETPTITVMETPTITELVTPTGDK